MIESSMIINDRMPEYCAQRAMGALNERKKAMNGAKVLVLGVAYKQDIDDYRESPALRVIEELEKEGACASSARRSATMTPMWNPTAIRVRRSTASRPLTRPRWKARTW